LLLPTDSETWRCTQALELVSSLEHKHEEAFFNQVAVLPQASLILLVNAKKNAIYAVHVEYGPDPASTRLDYIADFTVAMPILSLTGTYGSQPDGEQVVQVYCVQTMAIQQYGLEVSLCLPPTADNTSLGRDPVLSHVYDRPLEVASVESSSGTKPLSDHQGTGNAILTLHTICSVNSYASEVGGDLSSPLSVYADADTTAHVPSLTPTSNMNNAGSSADPSKGPSLGDHDGDQSSFDYSSKKVINGDGTSGQGAFGREDSVGKEDPTGQGEATVSDAHSTFNGRVKATHLITPSGIISGVIPSAETTAKGSPHNVEVESKHVVEKKPDQNVKFEAAKETQIVHEKMERLNMSSERSVESISERSVTTDKYNVDDFQRSDPMLSKQHSGAGDGNVRSRTTEVPEKTDVSVASRNLQLPAATIQKVLHPQVSGQLSPLTSSFNSNDSSPSNANPAIDSASQVAAIQGTLHQVVKLEVSLP
jgi:enhancer of mRNA-decapping protein 4